MAKYDPYTQLELLKILLPLFIPDLTFQHSTLNLECWVSHIYKGGF